VNERERVQGKGSEWPQAQHKKLYTRIRRAYVI
jgi:hypothetical protein